MKTIILIMLAAAGLACGQTLPYETSGTHNGWPTKQVFRQAPDDPNVAIVTTYSWVYGQNGYWAVKSTERADRAEVIKFVLGQQRKEESRRQASQAALAADIERRQARQAEMDRRARDSWQAEQIAQEVGSSVRDAIRQERRRESWR